MATERNPLGLNDLPDCILTTILSKVPLKQAVCCSILSKRWKFIWTSLPKFKISSVDLSFSSCSCIVDGIFEHHSGSLQLFEFGIPLHNEISDKISEWIQRAALIDVRDIKIEGNTINFFEVPTSIFLCHSLRSLSLKSFCFRNMPNYFVGLAGLETLNFENVELNDNIIYLMLQLCPVLKILSIFYCRGLRRLRIFSDSLVTLNLCSQIKAITANCPTLANLLLMKKFGNVVEMAYYLPACLSLCTDAAQFRMFTTLKSLRKITLVNLIQKHDVPILSEFPNLEQLCIGNEAYSVPILSEFPNLDQMLGNDAYNALESLWSNGAMQESLWSNALIPESSASSLLKNLKRVHLNMTLFYDPTPLLTYLLPRAPAMKSLLVSREEGFKGIKALRLINRLLNLQQEFTQTKILFSQDTVKEGRCLCDLE
ncbi:putative FBD-associated F-box protein At5g56700 isoform X1 [Cryptomeria japonica]|nr:putative FBD-associated F-box protein At5g56700 isoform X1 [Cryptomeria japonica]